LRAVSVTHDILDKRVQLKRAPLPAEFIQLAAKAAELLSPLLK